MATASSAYLEAVCAQRVGGGAQRSQFESPLPGGRGWEEEPEGGRAAPGGAGGERGQWEQDLKAAMPAVSGDIGPDAVLSPCPQPPNPRRRHLRAPGLALTVSAAPRRPKAACR